MNSLRRETDAFELATFRTDFPTLVKALKSIARNTCCNKCQEAAFVARAALRNVGIDYETDESL